MKLIHVLIAESDGRVSGRELRDLANFADMTRSGTVLQFFIGDFSCQKRVGTQSSTVLSVPGGTIDALNRQIEMEQPDAIVFEGVALLAAIEATRMRYPSLPIIIDFHNVEGDLYRKLRHARAPAFLRPLLCKLSASQLRAAELADRRAAELCSMIWVCSDEDRRRVLEFAPQCNTAVIANPIPDLGLPEELAFEGGRNEVLFVGHLGYDPNKFAARFLARELAPLLGKRLPEAKLHVCGRNPSRKLIDLLRSRGVKVTANPETLAPVYAAAAVTAIPLRHGGGTRIKVLEAMSAGCPIVATSIAVEGLGMEPGRHYLHAESAEDFCAAIVRVFEDPSLENALREAGRTFVQSRFSPDVRARAVQAALQRVIGT